MMAFSETLFWSLSPHKVRGPDRVSLSGRSSSVQREVAAWSYKRHVTRGPARQSLLPLFSTPLHGHSISMSTPAPQPVVKRGIVKQVKKTAQNLIQHREDALHVCLEHYWQDKVEIFCEKIDEVSAVPASFQICLLASSDFVGFWISLVKQLFHGFRSFQGTLWWSVALPGKEDPQLRRLFSSLIF